MPISNMAETNALLHDITLLERKLHGMITQRECLGVNTREAEETEGAIKKSLEDKKQKLRAIMEEAAPPGQPRQPAFIKNGVTLEMLHQIVEMEDKLCSVLPVLETKALDNHIKATLSGPAVVSNTPDDGAPNLVSHPPDSPSSSPPRFAACSVSTYPHVPEVAGTGRVCSLFCYVPSHFSFPLILSSSIFHHSVSHLLLLSPFFTFPSNSALPTNSISFSPITSLHYTTDHHTTAPRLYNTIHLKIF